MKFPIQSLSRNPIRKALSAVAQASTAILIFCASSSQALTFHVDVNTGTLAASSSAPFALDFQFNDGGVLGNNSATISNFTFSGGSASGSPTLLGATGDIGSSISFNNSNSFQELFQTFTSGTRLGFDVSMTTNLDGATPDAFAFAILDNGLLNIPTNGLGDSLVLVNLDSATPAVQTFAGTGDFAQVTVTAVPEPETFALMLLGLGLMGAFARRKKPLSLEA